MGKDGARSAPEAWLAVDIGATKLAVHAVGPAGPLEIARPWPAGGCDADLRVLQEMIRAARDHSGGAIRRVGVAAAPTVAAGGQVTAWPSRPAWIGLTLTAAVAEAAGAPVVVADDGALAALAEAAEAACSDLAYIGLGTGVGGGLVSAGRLVRGAFGTAGEIGHVVIDPAGPACPCGRRGCLQAYVGGAALARRAGDWRGIPASTRQLADGASSGEGWAVLTIAEAAAALAQAVVLLSEICGPGRVHIGGGAGTALTSLPQAVAAALPALARPGHELPTVSAALLGSRASLAGALLLAQRPAVIGPAPGWLMPNAG